MQGRVNICGIIYSQSFDGSTVNKRVVAQYKKQISRGIEGFGVFNGTHLVKAAEQSRILRWLKKQKNQSELLLFHHRWPTSTINVRRAAHPFTTKDYFGDTQYILVHNGHIGNALDLFENHQELGIEYSSLLEDMTFNDSEALLWDLALTLEGKQDALKAYGGIAFICMKMVNGEPDKLYFGRNWNKPLNMLRDKTQLFLSSEGEGEEIKPGQLHTYNYKLKRLTTRFFSIPASDPAWRSVWLGGQANRPAGGVIPSITTFNYDDEYDDNTYPYLNYEMTTPRYNETFTPDGVIWYDENGEEYFDSYGIYPMYYRRRNEDTADRSEHIRNVLGSPAYQGLFPSLSPTPEDVKANVYNYLGKCRGNFSLAYWMLEAEYEEVENEPLNHDRTRKLLLIKDTVNAIDEDDNFIDDNSIHPLWLSNNQNTLEIPNERG